MILSCLCLMSGPVHAQFDDVWTGGFFGGYSTSLNDGAPDGGFSGVANVFAMFQDYLGGGLEIGFHRLGSVQETVVDSSAMQTVQEKTSLSTWQGTAQLLLTRGKGSWRPYAEGGGGLYGVRTDFESDGIGNSTTNTKLGFNVGGGLKFVPGQGQWAVALDLRFTQILDGLEIAENVMEDLNMASVFLGLSFL